MGRGNVADTLRAEIYIVKEGIALGKRGEARRQPVLSGPGVEQRVGSPEVRRRFDGVRGRSGRYGAAVEEPPCRLGEGQEVGGHDGEGSERGDIEQIGIIGIGIIAPRRVRVREEYGERLLGQAGAGSGRGGDGWLFPVRHW